MGVIEKALSGYGFPKMLEARLLIRPAANFPYMMEVRSPLKYMLNIYQRFDWSMHKSALENCMESQTQINVL